MTMSAFGSNVVGRVDDSTEFGMSDFALKGVKIIAKQVTKTLQFREEILAIGLELLADLVTFLGRRGMAQFDEQEPLLLQELIASLVKSYNKGFYIVGNTA